MSAGFGSYLDSTGRSEPDYIDRTIATVRNHRDAENCWPQWANIFADEIEALRAELVSVRAEREQAAEAYEGRLANALAVARQLRDALERARSDFEDIAGYALVEQGKQACRFAANRIGAALVPPKDREGLPVAGDGVKAAATAPVAPPGAEPEDRRKELSGRLRTGNPASPVAVPQPPARQEVLPLVVADLTARIEKGTAEYGEPLTTRNGRGALRDAYEEALDLTLYLRQALTEGVPAVPPTPCAIPHPDDPNFRCRLRSGHEGDHFAQSNGPRDQWWKNTGAAAPPTPQEESQ